MPSFEVQLTTRTWPRLTWARRSSDSCVTRVSRPRIATATFIACAGSATSKATGAGEPGEHGLHHDSIGPGVRGRELPAREAIDLDGNTPVKLHPHRPLRITHQAHRGAVQSRGAVLRSPAVDWHGPHVIGCEHLRRGTRECKRPTAVGPRDPADGNRQLRDVLRARCVADVYGVARSMAADLGHLA